MMRKTITNDSSYHQYPIQVFDPPGAYVSILERNQKLINYALSKHSRVLVNGFCAKYPVRSEERVPRDLSNDTFLDFLESFRRLLWDNGFDPLIIWCREQENEFDIFGNPAYPHWHFTVLTDGNVNRTLNIFRIHKLWNMHLGLPPDSFGLINQIKFGEHSSGYMMYRDDHDSIARVVKAMSYLSKRKTKELTPSNVRMYDSSQLTNRKPHKKRKRP